MSSDSELQVLDNKNSGYFLSTNAFFGGIVRIAYCGGVHILLSVIWFGGLLEVVQNTGRIGGVFMVISSDVYLTNRALFSNNQADNGRAMSLISSVLHISPYATINFTNNVAGVLGGAIYIYEPRTTFSKYSGSDIPAVVCSIQALPDNSTDGCQFFSISFHQNKAGRAGNAIYGDYTSICLPYGKDVCST